MISFFSHNAFVTSLVQTSVYLSVSSFIDSISSAFSFCFSTFHGFFLDIFPHDCNFWDGRDLFIFSCPVSQLFFVKGKADHSSLTWSLLLVITWVDICITFCSLFPVHSSTDNTFHFLLFQSDISHFSFLDTGTSYFAAPCLRWIIDREIFCVVGSHRTSSESKLAGSSSIVYSWYAYFSLIDATVSRISWRILLPNSSLSILALLTVFSVRLYQSASIFPVIEYGKRLWVDESVGSFDGGQCGVSSKAIVKITHLPYHNLRNIANFLNPENCLSVCLFRFFYTIQPFENLS